MDSVDRATVLRPFMISPDSYQILRKLYYGYQPKDSKECCELRRKHLISLRDSTGEIELTIAGRAIYEAATISLEEIQESRPALQRATVITIAQLAAMALLLAALSLSGFFKKTLDAVPVLGNTTYAQHRIDAATTIRKNQHE